MCLSIFLASLYLHSRRLRTRILLIQRILVGSLASLVPLRLPERLTNTQYTLHRDR
uniref:60S ribosomal protein L19-3-like n=1 Tax=Rhizophora mucronata TaxID=61149 RepID=A0A2P2JVF9_RHIMU